MANKFVWSGATGLDDGTSWDNAYVSMVRDWGVEPSFDPAVDIVAVRSVHSEAPATNAIIEADSGGGGGFQVQIISVVGASVGTSVGAVQSGAKVASISTARIEIIGDVYALGIEFEGGNGLRFANSSAGDVTMDGCILVSPNNDEIRVGNALGGGTTFVLWRNCTIDINAASVGVATNGQTFKMLDCVWLSNNNDVITSYSNRTSRITIENVDFSVLTNNLLAPPPANVNVVVDVIRSVLGAGATIVDGAVSSFVSRITARHCQIGIDADPSFKEEVHTSEGTVVSDENVYRVGGAIDGVRATPISRNMDIALQTNIGFPGRSLEALPIVAFAPAGLKTYRLYIASNAQQTDKNIWAEFTLVSDVDTSSLAVIKSTRMAILGTPVAYPLDAVSSWVGSNTSVIQVIEVTHTAMKAGAVSAKLFMASDAGVDDFIHVDGVLDII